ncbi:hypothetical protein [Neisseria sp. 83E34]|uniref:hypothetical protein n=1 Tax=Neisseria sp. 83E34 TaxID=1692264 RepID=UPI0006CE9CE4|nr:hypothetical protein [Neisseria sp. 83E34]KPN72521.1 hypothetical protein AKG09_01340 [Neisseria sp. 83E34]
MNILGWEYRKTDGRYWWLLGTLALIGGMVGILPIIVALSINPGVQAARNPDMLISLALMGWRFGFLPSVLTWAVLFIMDLKRGVFGTFITMITAAFTSLLTGWLIYELSFTQGLLAGLCGAFAGWAFSLCLPEHPKKKSNF